MGYSRTNKPGTQAKLNTGHRMNIIQTKQKERTSNKVMVNSSAREDKHFLFLKTHAQGFS